MHHQTHPPAPTSIGTKFRPDGGYRRFPGNTVVAMVEPESPIRQALDQIRAILDEPLGSFVTFLPPDSWHMTAFELLLDELRQPELWSRFVDLDAPVEETDRILRAAVSQVPPPEVTMVGGVIRFQPGVACDLRSVDDETERSLRAYRERLSDVTGIRTPSHPHYRFHLSLAYVTTPPPSGAMAAIAEALTSAEQVLVDLGPFRLGKPSFRCFNDMSAFTTSRIEGSP
jgi:hypothetical protein